MTPHVRSEQGAGFLRLVVAMALGVAGAVALGSLVLPRVLDDGGTGPVGTLRETRLVVPDAAPAGRCMTLSPQALRNTDLAFDATVARVGGDEVVLDVRRWFFGGDADRVRLQTPARRSVLRLHGQPEFRAGQRWLVSATEGRANGCGFTVPWSEERAKVFAAAEG